MQWYLQVDITIFQCCVKTNKNLSREGADAASEGYQKVSIAHG